MIGLLWLYSYSVVFSFCFSMMGNCYLKNSGAVPEKFNLLIPTIVTSFIPISNIFLAIKTLRIGHLVSKHPKARDEYKIMFDNMNKEFTKQANDIISKMKDRDIKKEDKEADMDEK